MSDKWEPIKEDIIKVCEGVLEDYIREDNYSSDYCAHCYKEWGNHYEFYVKIGKKPLHNKDCIVPIAQDILTSRK